MVGCVCVCVVVVLVGWGGGSSHHVIREDKLMQTLLGHFELSKRNRRGRKTLNIVLFLSVLSKISRSVLLQRKCFINEASLYISSKK